MKVTGRCHCGRISFEAEIDPAAVRICHCTDCQTLSGSAFRVNVATLPGTFRLTAGTPKTYIKTTADSGNIGRTGSAPIAARRCGRPRPIPTRRPTAFASARSIAAPNSSRCGRAGSARRCRGHKT